jgi:hypothetical protein
MFYPRRSASHEWFGIKKTVVCSLTRAPGIVQTRFTRLFRMRSDFGTVWPVSCTQHGQGPRGAVVCAESAGDAFLRIAEEGMRMAAFVVARGQGEAAYGAGIDTDAAGAAALPFQHGLCPGGSFHQHTGLSEGILHARGGAHPPAGSARDTEPAIDAVQLSLFAPNRLGRAYPGTCAAPVAAIDDGEGHPVLPYAPSRGPPSCPSMSRRLMASGVGLPVSASQPKAFQYLLIMASME